MKRNATARKRTRQFHLEILFRTLYPHAIILAKPFEQVNARSQESFFEYAREASW